MFGETVPDSLEGCQASIDIVNPKHPAASVSSILVVQPDGTVLDHVDKLVGQDISDTLEVDFLRTFFWIIGCMLPVGPSPKITVLLVLV